MLEFDPQHCTLCPRQCRGDRTRRGGRCRMPAEPVLARAALHQWEEPPLSGTRGAGTVFFSGCSLGCVFCQNEAISQRDFGQPVSVSRLREIFQELIEAGAHNIDLVNPIHYAHVVLEALEEPLPVPVVWNSGGYDKVETLRALEGKVQIYLPDFKYMDEHIARAYSNAPDYPVYAKQALEEMVGQTGDFKIDERTGLMLSGVIVRHLVLPGHVKDSQKVIRYLYETYGDRIMISIMNQYTPMPQMSGHSLLGRKVTKREYGKVVDYALELGVECGFIQEGEAASESFVPEFDGMGV